MFRHFSRLPPALFALLLSPHLSAQSDFGVWAEADAQFKISKKWNVGIDAGLRTRSGLSAFDRWSIGASAEFEPVKFLSAGAGYNLQDEYKDSRTTAKGNVVDDYWRLRNRFYAQLKFKARPSVFKLDFRARYQLTHKSKVSIAKYSSAGIRKDNEVKEAENDNLVRLRLALAVKTRSPFTPQVYYELFNDLADGFALTKQRVYVGSDVSLSKRNELSVGYVRNVYAHSDADGVHNALAIGYKFKF